MCTSVWECETKEQLEQNNNSIILMDATVKNNNKTTAPTTNRIQQPHAINTSAIEGMLCAIHLLFDMNNVNVFY